mmetsp:Transcript_34152/g.50188  ORF Transcript_34152/g.50188 Transcript_34152/m.50188 type:complete len:821 (-) Transcript_34152:99-2561(-)|eukprot:CAMPEP_0195530584 /NCGR_PEP_ID=MMETSP0794_2-20130614/33550_1 /TAXON_ID=515487 /ORGANISM="Stephanopyxis turris, Strain CCMP 815" /LENGTH=820 /DNA_ID=CAMNT_0040662129 /DNA_START=182 /DNA_END=2644 /DNA_ORIENTATION=+
MTNLKFLLLIIACTVLPSHPLGFGSNKKKAVAVHHDEGVNDASTGTIVGAKKPDTCDGMMAKAVLVANEEKDVANAERDDALETARRAIEKAEETKTRNDQLLSDIKKAEELVVETKVDAADTVSKNKAETIALIEAERNIAAEKVASAKKEALDATERADSRIQAMENTFTELSTNVKAEAAASIAKIEASATESIAENKKKTEEEIAAVKKESDFVKQDAKARIDQAKEEAASEIQKMKKETADEIERAKASAEGTVSQIKEWGKQLEEDTASQIKTTRETADNQIAAVIKDAEATVSEVKKEADEQTRNAQARADTAIKNALAEADMVKKESLESATKAQDEAVQAVAKAKDAATKAITEEKADAAKAISKAQKDASDAVNLAKDMASKEIAKEKADAADAISKARKDAADAVAGAEDASARGIAKAQVDADAATSKVKSEAADAVSKAEKAAGKAQDHANEVEAKNKALHEKILDLKADIRKLEVELDHVHGVLSVTSKDLKQLQEKKHPYCNVTLIKEDSSRALNQVTAAADRRIRATLVKADRGMRSSLVKTASKATDISTSAADMVHPHFKRIQELYEEHLAETVNTYVMPTYNNHVAPALTKIYSTLIGMHEKHIMPMYYNHVAPAFMKMYSTLTDLGGKAVIKGKNGIRTLSNSCVHGVEQFSTLMVKIMEEKDKDRILPKFVMGSFQFLGTNAAEIVQWTATLVFALGVFRLRLQIFKHFMWLVLVPFQIFWFLCPLRLLLGKRKTNAENSESTATRKPSQSTTVETKDEIFSDEKKSIDNASSKTPMDKIDYDNSAQAVKKESNGLIAQ